MCMDCVWTYMINIYDFFFLHKKVYTNPVLGVCVCINSLYVTEIQ